MQLHLYLRKKDISRARFADALSVHLGTIDRLCGPSPRPCGAKLAKKIVVITDGEVSFDDLLNPTQRPKDGLGHIGTQESS